MGKAIRSQDKVFGIYRLSTRENSCTLMMTAADRPSSLPCESLMHEPPSSLPCESLMHNPAGGPSFRESDLFLPPDSDDRMGPESSEVGAEDDASRLPPGQPERIARVDDHDGRPAVLPSDCDEVETITETVTKTVTVTKDGVDTQTTTTTTTTTTRRCKRARRESPILIESQG